MRKFYCVTASPCRELEQEDVLLMIYSCRYPPQMIPGIDIVIHTTATNDRDARLLLSSFGLPFDGKHWAKA